VLRVSAMLLRSGHASTRCWVWLDRDGLHRNNLTSRARNGFAEARDWKANFAYLPFQLCSETARPSSKRRKCPQIAGILPETCKRRFTLESVAQTACQACSCVERVSAKGRKNQGLRLRSQRTGNPDPHFRLDFLVRKSVHAAQTKPLRHPCPLPSAWPRSGLQVVGAPAWRASNGGPYEANILGA
jgi:hypothetical protein